MPKFEDMTEPDVTINGVALTFGQSMALRVAVSNFVMTLQDDPDALGTDKHGRIMTENYSKRLTEVLKLMIDNQTT